MVFTGVIKNSGHQADTLRRVMQKGRSKSGSRVLAVSSGKGGVGKTNVVANLAIALSRQGYRVLVFDADIGLNNIDILLGLAPRYHIGHVFNGEKRIEEILVEGPKGMKVLPASNGWQDLTTLDHEKKLLLLEELDRLIVDYDFLIFDTGAGISSNVTYFCSAAHETLLVATPEPTSHTDVYALMKVLCQNHSQKDFQLIINSVKSEREALEIYRRLTDVIDRFLPQVSLNYLGHILYDENVTRSVRQQRAVLDLYPHSKVSQCIQQLSEKILQTHFPNQEERDRPFLWKNVFEVR
ncbi:MAG: P-loop NTPase [Nitrospinaceae bacterium]|nr:MinD/ParA family protein [Nitrospinaceae bacterium]NIR55855.1 MinD/ParA family protein [Nitrospinaceae bacterium]NIS86308.1 MinD/ParA family protein [Nitrospinaceae bacterium]NIT83136.1 MinD/ParA family protein [Nitrospinaceae bacterium]NIU45347.1 MinD/ParA family protein [Nitrospinaceae bacterium]